MNNLEIAKNIIKEHYNKARCGLFDNRNCVGDRMSNIYNKNGLIIDICYDWEYFEVLGLSEEDFEELNAYYLNLRRQF